MNISVIVSTKNRLPELTRFLKTLRAQSRRPEELVVVDADCDPRVASLVKGLDGTFPKTGYHALPSSLTQARNHGIRNSTGDVVVFLDDDLLLETDFIHEIARPFEEDRDGRIAGVTGDIVNHPRGRDRLLQAFKFLFQLPRDGSGRFRLSGAPTTVHGLSGTREVEFVPGGITAWRREVFAEFLFDESLPGLGINEDVDFSYRVSRKWRNFYTPKARARHERPSLERETSWKYLRLEFASSWHLYKKNQPKDPVHFAAFLWHGVGLLLRFAFRRWLRR